MLKYKISFWPPHGEGKERWWWNIWINIILFHGKSPNGYCQWNCSRRSCKTCKDCKPAELKCQTSNEIVSVDQFEVVTKEYLKFNKKTKEMEKKRAKLTDHVSSQMTYKDLYKKLISVCKNYTTSKYHVYDDHHHWPIILSTTARYGEITHADSALQITAGQ